MYNILIVDDEDIIRRGLERSLSRLGFFNIYTARDGIEAMQIIENICVDAMILDICMPQVNGIKVMEELSSQNKDILIFVLSGHDEFEYAQKALKCGAFDYILKPVDSEDAQSIGIKIKQELDKKFQIQAEYRQLKEEVDKYRQLIEGKVDWNDQNKKFDLSTMIKEYIHLKYNEDITVTQLAEIFNFSPNYLGHVFKESTGFTITDYVCKARIEHAKVLLKNTPLMVYEIAQKVGFSDQHYFSQVFKRLAGCSPKEFRDC